MKLLNWEGISPVRMLSETLKMLRVLALDLDDLDLNRTSREPVSLLLPKSAYCRVGMLKNPGGRPPLNSFSLKTKFSNLRKLETHEGMVPLK